MADISRNQMIFWMPLAGLKSFFFFKIMYIHMHKFGFYFSRKKYERRNISFRSIGDLRREFPSQDSLSTLQLIKSFVEKIKKDNENADLARYSLYNVFEVVLQFIFRFW